MSSSGRIRELDGVRGCAIALVLSWHLVFNAIHAPPATFWSYVQAAGRLTWSGVDLFFVLSGFLIGGILVDSRDSDGYFRTFYARRFYRIVPLYFVVVAVALVFDWSTNGTVGQHVPILSYFVFLQNFWMARYATWGTMLLGVTWSLAVEEQFYLTLPTVVRLTNPKSLARIIGIGILIATCIRILFLYGWPQNPFLSYVLMPCRADALLLGVLGAIWMRNPRVNQWLHRNGRVLLAVLLFFVAGAGLLTKYAVSWETIRMRGMGYTWLAGLYLCAVLYVLTQSQSWPACIMRQRLLCWLGSISYGVYLLHLMISQLIFHFVWGTWSIQLGNWENVAAIALALGLTLAICQISWVTFEKPLLRRGHRHRYRNQSEQLPPPASRWIPALSLVWYGALVLRLSGVHITVYINRPIVY